MNILAIILVFAIGFVGGMAVMGLVVIREGHKEV